MDLSKLPIKPTKRSQTTDPKDIFKSLTLRGPIQNVWGPQAEALERWHQNRKHTDVVIGMNTGGGKTLVGLLIAQSLVNETKGKVLYVCPTNQLVEQAAVKANECGIEVATYMGSAWENESVYTQSTGPCLTNYAAVLNGKAIFRKHNISAIVFDDSHVAGNFARSHFTIKIPQSHPAFQGLSNLFRGYFYQNSQAQQFDNAVSGDYLSLLFVPMFEVRRQADEMRKIFTKSGVDQAKETTFPWVYLKDRLSRCTVILSGSGIEIAPPVLPVHTLPYFQKDVRRVYLTATLPTQIEFLRTFGISNPTPIIPGGKSGDAQRLFLFLQGRTDDEQQRKLALKLTEKHKACIITSSDHGATEWCPPATKFSGTNAAMQTFAKSAGTEKLVMAARYDGVDLPGDSCRVLVVDGLPTGASLFERFTDQGLRIERLRSSHLAVRITQAIGRIFRSNTDHGAVLLCGAELQRWLADPQNQQYLPRLLQQQLNFGLELARMIDEGHTTYEDLLNGVLKGRKDWDQLYSSHVEDFETQVVPTEPQWFVDLVLGEVEAFAKLWDGNFSDAAGRYAAIADVAETNDDRLAAWFRHWEGLARDLAKDDEGAGRAYVRAANKRSELGRPALKKGVVVAASTITPSPQAQKIFDLLKKKGHKISAYLAEIEKNLSSDSSTNTVEQAIQDLGTVLGLESSRPDHQTGSGPDVLWRYAPARAGAALEAKTDKKPKSQYTKKEDIGQYHDHVGWLQKNHKNDSFSKIIVGPKLKVSRESHPPGDLRIITLEQFATVAKRIKEAIEFAVSIAQDDERLVSIERALRDMGLTWPQCIDSLESFLAIDLKDANVTGEVT